MVAPLAPAPGVRARTLAVLVVLAAALLALPGLAHAARRRAPTAAPNDVTIDGPDATISSLNGLSIARDGTGGLVYEKSVGGIAHVYLSDLAAGSFQAPVQVDAGLVTGSSQPVVVAGNGGLLIVAFVNDGNLYVASTPGGGAPLGPPELLFAGATNPSMAISTVGKAYLAFTAGATIRAAYYYGGQWGLEGPPLNNDPSVGAGTGTDRPQVATAGDGVAIVAWGEGGHIFTRRIVRTTPSVVDEQADPSSQDGWSEVAATSPVISVGGDSSYANVSFQETFAAGAARQTRVLTNRLRGSQYDGVVEIDGEPMGGGQNTDQPASVSTEYGDGFITSEHAGDHTLYAAHMGHNEAVTSVFRVDSLPNSGPPDAVPATAGLTSTLIAWQQDPGQTGPAEIRLRYAQDGVNLADEQVLSSPTLGPTDAAAGLAAAGDVQGDAAVAWIQGSGDTTRVEAEQLYVPPGSFVASDAFHDVTTAHPVLSWSASAENWGAPLYTVAIDGIVVGQTTALSLQIAPALTDGRHTYQVTATNQAGVATSAPAAAVFVDTVAPQLRLRLTGPRTITRPEKATVAYRDLPPAGLPRSDASGVATVFIHWGDGTTQRIRRTTATHDYRRARTYRVTVTATDRAGNATTATQRLRVVKPHRATRRRRARRPGKR